MQSIGERLEEARKRRGVSVREASEATKIRGDFLLNFENNQFDVGLPELYVRGFLRNYSSFLKIDGEKVVTDYTAALIGEGRPARKEQRELFGRIELPDRARPASDSPTASSGVSAAPTRRPAAEPAESSFGDRERHERDRNRDLVNYAKIAGVAAAGLIAILVIVWLVKAIVGGGPSATSGGAVENPSSAANTAALESITLVALDTVRVKVTQSTDNAVIFDGGLARDETKVIAKRGPVTILYDVGRNLNVVKDSKRYKMPQDGIGRSSIP